MVDEAIQAQGQEIVASNADVSVVKGDEKVKPTINVDEIVDQNRLNYLDQIAKRNREKIKDDFQPFDGEDVVEEEKEVDAPTDDSGAEGKKESKPTATEAAADDDMVTVKIDGREEKVSRRKIEAAGIRTYQKEGAADKRLEDATKLLRDLQAERDLLRELQAERESAGHHQKQEQGAQAQQGHAELSALKEHLNVKTDLLAHAQAYGTPEEFKRALAEYNDASHKLYMGEVHSLPQRETDVSAAIRRELEFIEVERVRVSNDQIIKKLAEPTESGGYKDLLDNPKYGKIFEIEVDELLSSGKPNVYETYSEAGENVRKMLGLTIGKPAEANPKARIDQAALEEKRKRKLSEIDNINVTGARAPGTNADDRPKSFEEKRRDALQQLMKARGQVASY